LNITQYPFIFSPNFDRYIDLDDDHTSFQIRLTFGKHHDDEKREEALCDIPDELMNAINEPLEDVVRRFRWVTKDILHVVNPEGIEKYVSIKNDFKDIQLNFIPLYDPLVC
jgi:hypothetical protein